MGALGSDVGTAAVQETRPARAGPACACPPPTAACGARKRHCPLRRLTRPFPRGTAARAGRPRQHALLRLGSALPKKKTLLDHLFYEAAKPFTHFSSVPPFLFFTQNINSQRARAKSGTSWQAAPAAWGTDTLPSERLRAPRCEMTSLTLLSFSVRQFFQWGPTLFLPTSLNAVRGQRPERRRSTALRERPLSGGTGSVRRGPCGEGLYRPCHP